MPESQRQTHNDPIYRALADLAQAVETQTRSHMETHKGPIDPTTTIERAYERITHGAAVRAAFETSWALYRADYEFLGREGEAAPATEARTNG